MDNLINDDESGIETLNPSRLDDDSTTHDPHNDGQHNSSGDNDEAVLVGAVSVTPIRTNLGYAASRMQEERIAPIPKGQELQVNVQQQVLRDTSGIINQDESSQQLSSADGNDYNMFRRKLLSICRRKTTFVGISIVCAVVLVAALTAILATGKGKIAGSPTFAPSSQEQQGDIREIHILRLLDQKSSLNITFDDVNSPQRRALDWLLSDSYSQQVGSTDWRNGSDRLLQRFALAVLWFTTGGIAWRKNSSRWLENVHECFWELIECNNETNAWIVSLNLGFNGLVGSFPPELSLLTHLQALHLEVNEISGTIQEESLGRLSHLRSLVLASNAISGTIPTALFSLTGLTLLDLSGNLITGTLSHDIFQLSTLEGLLVDENHFLAPWTLPLEISFLTNLRQLGLTFSSLSGSLPTSIGHLTKLTVLELDENFHLSGSLPSEVGLLTALTQLKINNDQLSGVLPREISRLTNLVDLRCQDNDLVGPLFPLENLTSLKKLYLHGNPGLTGTFPASLCSSLRPSVDPGSFIVCDCCVDVSTSRTHNRDSPTP